VLTWERRLFIEDLDFRKLLKAVMVSSLVVSFWVIRS